MYLYETHLHTSPVSKCAGATVRENIEYYKSIGYAGIFITNHFIDGNIDVDRSLPYADRIRFYFSDYHEGVRIGQELDFPVFCGVEMSFEGTDFLVYGLEEDWFLAHPEIEHMKKTEQLPMMMEAGALVIHAHPFREAGYIDHIRLFPRCVHGVEVINANRTDFVNEMGAQYAANYGLLSFAGSDNHSASRQKHLAGMQSDTPIRDVDDFIARVKAGEMSVFVKDVED